jgi:GT2 family glycosyltransferase
VSVIIVNWNGRHHLAECLDSLAAQSFRDFEVILVDNGSTDGSVSFVREQYPWVKLVPLDRNTGFAAGNNAGLANATGAYVVTLNNDTVADPEWLSHLVAVADENPAAGMVGCRICAYDDPDIIDSLGMGICSDGMSRGMYRLRRWDVLQLEPVTAILFPSACAALYRRAMLDQIGFFDEDFFAYCEDTDLGLRGRLAGWEALLAANAVVRHKYSMTGGTFSPLKIYLVERNHYWAALKSFPLQRLFLLPFATAMRFFVQARVVLAGSGSGAEFQASSSRGAIILAIARGILDALADAAWMLRKRHSQPISLTPQEMTTLLDKYRLSFQELLDSGEP